MWKQVGTMKCPKGFRYDKSEQACVPTKAFQKWAENPMWRITPVFVKGVGIINSSIEGVLNQVPKDPKEQLKNLQEQYDVFTKDHKPRSIKRYSLTKQIMLRDLPLYFTEDEINNIGLVNLLK